MFFHTAQLYQRRKYLSAAQGILRPMWLREIRLSRRAPETWPWTIPALSEPASLRLESPVTIFVGENGSGKSTLLEAIARKAALPAIGGEDTARDETLRHLDAFATSLSLKWSRRTGRGFFLRMEDFFAFSRRLRQTQAELQVLADGYQAELRQGEGRNLLRDEGLKRARGVTLGQKHALTSRYGEDLDARSHGESLLHLLESRLVPDGLYLLDEPEAALSPLRQLALLSMLKAAVEAGSQFLIATHAPMLMALPQSQILSFNQSPPSAIGFDEIEHVTLMRAFLSDPEAFTRRL